MQLSILCVISVCRIKMEHPRSLLYLIWLGLVIGLGLALIRRYFQNAREDQIWFSLTMWWFLVLWLKENKNNWRCEVLELSDILHLFVL